ncbi:hypothetical protein DFAR_400017 [Desulfarculales bacterium]
MESTTQSLEAFKSGTRHYDPIVIEEEASSWGGAAVVRGKFNLKNYNRDRTIEGVNRFSMAIMSEPAGARGTSFQATGIPQTK